MNEPETTAAAEVARMMVEQQFKCRACGTVWPMSETLVWPFYSATTRTCGDATCGACCDPVKAK